MASPSQNNPTRTKSGAPSAQDTGAAAPKSPETAPTQPKKPATAAKKPAPAAKKPTTTVKKSASAAKKSTPAAKKPVAAAKKPATTAPAEPSVEAEHAAVEPSAVLDAVPANAAAVSENPSAPASPLATPLPADNTPEVKATPAAAQALTARITADPADLADSADLPADALMDNAPGLVDEDADEPEETPIDFDELRLRLMALQQQIRAAKIPVVIVFEGWDASGKGTVLSKLIEGLDPRGYQVFPVGKPSEHDRRYPALRRFWLHMPAAGNISLFCSSWYREVSTACLESKPSRKRLHQTFQEIVSMESQLVASGTLILKFFLHISRKEQKRRLKELESRKSTRWRVEKQDWLQNERYEDALRLYDAMIARTHFEGAAWHVLRSDSKRACVKQVYDTVIAAFQAALLEREAGLRAWDTPFLAHLESTATVTFPPLETFDPEQALSDPYKPAIDKAQKQLRKLQNELYRRGIPMVVGFEGWDAAGKGGAIRRLTSALDARGFDVAPIAAPTPIELSHHYLWRFWKEVPADGRITIFDRTWYGRVLVERVEQLCSEASWKRAYEEINRFEAELSAHGIIQCKFWLQIDQGTQLVRFNDREASPEKQWKITPDDWRNRDKWPQYATAVNDMLLKTNTAVAPWTVVEANNKQFARLKVLQSVIRAIETRLEADKA